jgi:hypothetical protein
MSVSMIVKVKENSASQHQAVKGNGNAKYNLPRVEKVGSEDRRTHAAALS